jgi:pre-60S factor REI1
MCLFCDDRGKRFQSLEAVRKHMVSKSHCKLRFGDGEGAAEEELEDFYDYTSSYVAEDGTQLVKVENAEDSPVSLVSGGLELLVRSDSADGKVSKTIGSRELFRYYKLRPKPTDQRDGVAVNAVVAKYRSMGLATRDPEQKALRRAGTKNIPSQRLEAFRSKVAMNNNLNWNLPKNVAW